MKIRPPAVANQFYPGNAHSLKQAVLEALAEAPGFEVPGNLKAVIVPHAGYKYSAGIAAHCYKLFKGLAPGIRWKVLLLGPSHHVPFGGAAASEFEKWETPLGEVVVRDIRDEIGECENIADVPGASDSEHSLEVQLPFLQMVLGDFELYPLMLGSVRGDILGEELSEFVARPDVIVVVSSDLSHFMPGNKARELDLATSKAILDLDIERFAEVGDACGRMGIVTLMYLAKKLGWKGKMLKYANSGDVTGDYSKVVGYGAYAFIN
ncbi:AmmeMemoRadiSam system protein B [Patescibacteria group bacterium]|nr:AmmeMemoRadiSam system protein B [Patescibacteria group bacterium]